MPLDGTLVSDTAAHLLRAKAYIEKYGWCSQGPYDGVGRICAANAIYNTCISEGSPVSAYLRFLGVISGTKLKLIKWDALFEITDWNDTPGRTLDEVYDAFDRAIAAEMRT